MIGAVVGRDKLPADYVNKVLNCPAKNGQEGLMPEEVQPAFTYQDTFDKMF